MIQHVEFFIAICAATKGGGMEIRVKKISYLLLGMLCCLCLSACSKKFTSIDTAMGTIIKQTIYTTGEDVTEEVLAVMTDLENNVLSWRKESSEIAIINANAGKNSVEMSQRLESYMEMVLDVAEKSEGAFDPTVGLITREWDIDGENPHVPSEEILQKMVADAGYEKIQISENKISLCEDVTLDLGAAGKGIACDEARAYLSQNKSVTGAVIAAGGSIVTYGKKPDGGDWNVGIQDPRKESAYLGVLRLKGEWYISTSGDYERYFEQDGVRYHHIIDPKTGYPANSEVISVTIICDNGLLSDALSTACFILGVEDGMKLAQDYNAYAIFVDEDKNIYTSDFENKFQFELIAEGYKEQTNSVAYESSEGNANN